MASTTLHADELNRRAYMFTAEEIYDMAQAMVGVSQKQKMNQNEVLNAMQFRGYIAGLLDSAKGKQYQECARRKKLSEIVTNTAIVITSQPLDRSLSYEQVLGTIYFSILFACDDQFFKKK